MSNGRLTGMMYHSAGPTIHPTQAAQARALRAESARLNPGGCEARRGEAANRSLTRAIDAGR